MTFSEKLRDGASLYSLDLTDDQCDRFYTFFELLIEKNKVMNLTAIVEEDEVIAKHFLDSMSGLCVAQFGEGARVLDLGTGAGFPGIPLKIARPDLDIVLLDSLSKRVNFLTETVEKLGLSGVKAIHSRAEDLARKPEFREKSDFVVSRAVASLPVLLEYALPFVKTGGYFLAYKSVKVDEEIEAAGHALSVLGGEITEVKTVEIKGFPADRRIVVVRKGIDISSKYPRISGKIQKEPL